MALSYLNLDFKVMGYCWCPRHTVCAAQLTCDLFTIAKFLCLFNFLVSWACLTSINHSSFILGWQTATRQWIRILLLLTIIFQCYDSVGWVVLTRNIRSKRLALNLFICRKNGAQKISPKWYGFLLSVNVRPSVVYVFIFATVSNIAPSHATTLVIIGSCTFHRQVAQRLYFHMLGHRRT